MGKKEERILKKLDKGREQAEKKEHKKTFKERLNDFKDFCVKDTSRMILLVAILIVLYLLLNLFMQDKQLAQIDLTEGKLHTLTDRSKDIAKNIEKDITFYLWQIDDNDGIPDLLRQYNRENSKISFKQVTIDDKDLIQKFGFEDGYPSIVASSSNGNTAWINESDLWTYDDSLTIIDLSEQKITNSLLFLNNDKQYKVYILAGKTPYDLDTDLETLWQYLEYDNYIVDTLNLGATGAIPEDCDVILIFGLTEDFTTSETNLLLDYIAKGGDLVIANDIDTTGQRSLVNFQTILDEYCIKLPNYMVQETSKDKIVNQSYQGLTFKGTINADHEITRAFRNVGYFPLMSGVGPIELDYTKAYSNNVEPTAIIASSNYSNLLNMANKTVDESGTSYTLAAAIIKSSESGQESRLVVFGTAESFSNHMYVNDDNYAYPFINDKANLSAMLNSFAFVSNQGELYSIRKVSSETYFSATVDQTKKVLFIVTFMPFFVAITGIVVCHKRRKLK